MNLAALQAQLLQTLFAALKAADQRADGSPRPAVAQATFLGFTEGGGDGHGDGARAATALIGGRAVRLAIAPGAEALDRLQPGARLTLAFEPAMEAGATPRARIIDARPPVSAPTDGAEAAPPSLRLAAAPVAMAALARQDSAAPLVATLHAIRQAPEQALRLPAPVQRAMAALTPSADALTRPDGAPLRQAIAASGLFRQHGPEVEGQAPKAGLALDLRSALLTLKTALVEAGAAQGEKPALDSARATTSPSATSPSAASRPAPPAPDAPLQPRGDVAARLPDAASPGAALSQVLAETDAALDRLTLHHYASLPDAGPETAAGAPSSQQPPTRLHLELPFLLDGKAGTLPLSIEEEPPERSSPESEAAHSGWRVRLALDLEPLGLIQALIGLHAGALRVAVFAEREATARLARRHAGDLEAALADGPFNAAVVDVALGQAPPPRGRAARIAGHFLDRRS
jgi:hypothetical protein